jgi:hypothetical protein
VATGIDRGARFVDGADLPAADTAFRHERRVGPAPEELDDRDLRSDLVERVAIDEQHEKAGADRTGGQLADFVDQSPCCSSLCARDREHAETTEIGHLSRHPGRHDARHRGQLDRQLATDELSESVVRDRRRGRGRHGVSSTILAAGVPSGLTGRHSANASE